MLPSTLTVRLAYAPGLPPIPAPQQHIFPLEPPAPHTSITALPIPGAFQQNWSEACVPPVEPEPVPTVYAYTVPGSRFSSTANGAVLSLNMLLSVAISLSYYLNCILTAPLPPIWP